MSLLAVLKYPHPFLRSAAKPITHFDAALRDYAASMFETMYEEHGCGLAATQVGYEGRLAVIDISKDFREPLCLVNPEILSKTENYAMEEGCLSIPGIYATVSRAKEIEVRYQDLEGYTHTLSAKDFLAVCIQHEIDHLNGILFFDHLSRLKRDRLLEKYEKLHRRNI